MAVHGLRGPVDAAHDLGAARIFEIRETRGFFEVVGEEDVEEAGGFSFLAEEGDYGRCLPAIGALRELSFDERLGGDAFCFDPLVDLADEVDGSELGNDPWWVAVEGCRLG